MITDVLESHLCWRQLDVSYGKYGEKVMVMAYFV